MAIAFGSCALTSGRDSGIINHVIVLHAPATRVPAHLLTNPLVAAQNSGTGTSEVCEPSYSSWRAAECVTYLSRHCAGQRVARCVLKPRRGRSSPYGWLGAAAWRYGATPTLSRIRAWAVGSGRLMLRVVVWECVGRRWGGAHALLWTPFSRPPACQSCASCLWAEYQE